MTELNHIVIIEGSRDEFNHISTLLNETGLDIKRITLYASVNEFMKTGESVAADVILLNLADKSESETKQIFDEVKNLTFYTPVIIITNESNSRFTYNLLQDGLQDIILSTYINPVQIRQSVLNSIHRKKNVNILAENQKRLNAVLDTNPDCIKLLGPECELFSINKAGLKLLEIDNVDSVIGKRIIGVVTEPYRESVLKLIASVFKGESGMLQYQILSAKGNYFWCEMIAVPYYNAEGKISFALSVTRDITKLVEEEKEIKKSNDRFSRIASTTNDAIWEWDLLTGELWGNENHQKLYGLAMKDPVPAFTEWVKRLHPDDRDPLIKKQQTALDSQTNVFISEYRFKTEKGDYKTIYDRCYISRNEKGQPVLMTGSMMDITERKKVEEALYASEENYRTLVEQATDGIFIADPSGKFLVVNTAGCRLSQYSLEELQRLTIFDLTLPEELLEKPFDFEVIKSPDGGRSERKLRKKDGTVIDIEINAKLLSNGKFLAFVREITLRKKAEKDLQDSYAAIRTLSSHLQNIREEERAYIAREIHDELGQQLTVLKLDLSWLQRKISNVTEEAVTLRIDEMLKLLNETVNSVRRISSSLRPSLLDDIGLVAAVEWQLQEFEKRTGVNTYFVSNETSYEMPSVTATGLFRIIQESLTNITRHARATEVNISLFINDQVISLNISDNGIGFDPENNINNKTFGVLGMQERTLAMGGVFKIRSVKGKGTTVEVEVPVEKKQG
ncbi:MAG: PAS domain S-box protein [Lacibacter sp.]